MSSSTLIESLREKWKSIRDHQKRARKEAEEIATPKMAWYHAGALEMAVEVLRDLTLLDASRVEQIEEKTGETRMDRQTS